MAIARGSFDVKAEREPPYQSVEGLVLARTRLEKAFSGDLVGTSSVTMLSAGTPVQGSAAYVALELVEGELGGKRGSFVLAHLGLMNRGQPSLRLQVVPDSGTAGLTGLTGHMQIEISEGKHSYVFEYELPG